MLRRGQKRRIELEKPSNKLDKDNTLSDQSDSDSELKSAKRIPRNNALGQKRKDKATTILESVVLGGADDIIENLESECVSESKTKKEKYVPKRVPVWNDDDDELDRIDITKEKRFEEVRRSEDKLISSRKLKTRLKEEFERVTGTPLWAELGTKSANSSDEEDEENGLLQKATSYLTGSVSLKKGVLDFKKCPDANKEKPTKGKLRSVQFHPTAQVILTAGADQSLNIFQVDGKTNSKIQSMFLQRFPILKAQFTMNGDEVFMGSKAKNFYYYDMIAGKVVCVPPLKGSSIDHTGSFEMSPDGKYMVILGKYGQMHLVSVKSKEYMDTLKMNGSVDCIAFDRTGDTMLSHGDDGEVYIWDMNRRDCVHRFKDDGCLNGTSIGISPNTQYIACGSDSGIVNVYDFQTCMSEKKPQPIKIVKNLVTPCTNVKFSPTSEMLAISSNEADRAFKMVHTPSMTVFSNFPDLLTENLRIPYCMDFSPNSGYLSIGDHKGTAHLYRLKHYENY